VIRQLRGYPFILWFAAAFLMVSGFVEFTDEFLEGNQPRALDVYALRGVAELRSPLLTVIFINLTALGSSTLITLHTIIAFCLLMTAQDKTGARQLVIAAAGSLALTELTKAFIGRPRPTAVPALVEAFGFSYPSGHALSAAAMYVTLAILASRHLSRLKQRILLGCLTVIIVGGVGLSRVYLGVHYASDVLSGICLGTAWALLLAGVVAYREHRAKASVL
jgi:undecaprenyl-diphosphatase